MRTQRQTESQDPTASGERPSEADTESLSSEPAHENVEALPSTEAPETSYLPKQGSMDIDERWQRIQSEFVDDPRKSVAEAHALVGELMQRIADNFAQERSGLEQQWSEGQSASTEDLRVCLQRYRDFFSRLLPTASQVESRH